jgi:hypothetical protein
MTKYEANVISAYTGILCAPLSQVHEFIQCILGREVLVSELADYRYEIKTASRPEFLRICSEVKIEEVV